MAANFVDAFVTCSLDIDAISDIVKEVQEHSHTLSCRKHKNNCRFGYPRFPSNKTLIAQPLNKEDFTSEDAYKKEKKRLNNILDQVKKKLIDLKKEDLESISIEEILIKADVSSKDYYDALQASQTRHV